MIEIILLFLLFLIDLAFLHYLIWGYQPNYVHFVIRWRSQLFISWKSIFKKEEPSPPAKIAYTFSDEVKRQERLPQSMTINDSTSEEEAARIARTLKKNKIINERAECEKFILPLERLQAWRDKVQWIGALLLIGHIIFLFLIILGWKFRFFS